MTTIIAVDDGLGNPIFGWDSRVSDGSTKYDAFDADIKVFSPTKRVILGVSGALAFSSRLHYGVMKFHKKDEPERWVYEELAPHLRYLGRDGVRESGDAYGDVIAYVGGDLFNIDTDGSIIPIQEVFAVGSGSSAALASYRTTSMIAYEGATRERVRIALTVASEIDSGTGGTLHVRNARDILRDYHG